MVQYRQYRLPLKGEETEIPPPTPTTCTPLIPDSVRRFAARRSMFSLRNQVSPRESMQVIVELFSPRGPRWFFA